jgi:hypothetical protein
MIQTLGGEMKQFSETLVYGFALGMGFKIGWDVIGWLLSALSARVG